MTPKLTPLVLNATLLFVSACGGGSAMPLDDAFPDRSEFAVEVENNHFADAQVYVVFQGGSRRRVGTVTGKTSKSFTLRHSTAAFVFIVDYTAGGRTQRTQSATARPGDAFLLRTQERQPLILIRR
jgi:hypothetical protein